MFGLPFDPDNLWPRWEIPEDELRAGEKGCANIVEFAEWFYRTYLLRGTVATRWADKTPNNVRVVDRLLAWFPEGRFIHVIRDGRDVVCSLRHHPKQKYVGGEIVAQEITNPISRCASRWLEDTSAGLAYEGHPRYLSVRYEELVSDPRPTMARVCAFLNEPFAEPMIHPNAESNDRRLEGRVMCNENAIKPISSQSVGRWKRDLSSNEQREFCDIAGELLIALGYATNHDWVLCD